jgi:hypothetical protein
MKGDILDRMAVREAVENWVVWRDGLMWDRFRTLWHPEGRMMATWFHGTTDEFIKVTQEGYAKGVRIFHYLHGCSVDINGKRAIAQTKSTISQRAMVDGVECDVTCDGRLYDFLEKRKGKWGFVLCRRIYEKDRIDPVDPSATLKLDQKLLKSFPIGFRHLGYLQTKIGYKVPPTMPGLDDADVKALYAQGAEWLKGKKKLPW